MDSSVYRLLITGPHAVGKTYLMKSISTRPSIATCDTDVFFKGKIETLNSLSGSEHNKLYDEIVFNGFINFEKENPSDVYLYFGLIDQSSNLPFEKFDKIIVLMPDIHVHAKQYLTRSAERMRSNWINVDWKSKEEFESTRCEFLSNKSMNHFMDFDELKQYLNKYC